MIGGTEEPMIERSLVDLTDRVEFFTPSVNLPLMAPPGTLITSCVGDWLTKVVTELVTPINDAYDTRSRLVPVIVTFVSVSTGLGVIFVIAGNATSRSIVDTVLTPDAAASVTFP